MEAEHGVPSFLARRREQVTDSSEPEQLRRTAFGCNRRFHCTPVRESSVWLWWYLEIVFESEIPPQKS